MRSEKLNTLAEVQPCPEQVCLVQGPRSQQAISIRASLAHLLPLSLNSDSCGSKPNT